MGPGGGPQETRDNQQHHNSSILLLWIRIISCSLGPLSARGPFACFVESVSTLESGGKGNKNNSNRICSLNRMKLNYLSWISVSTELVWLTVTFLRPRPETRGRHKLPSSGGGAQCVSHLHSLSDSAQSVIGDTLDVPHYKQRWLAGNLVLAQQ